MAVRTLLDEGHAGKEYVLTGPESLSQREQISMIGRAIGRPLRVEEVSPDEARRTCLSAMPPAVATKLLDAWAAGIGQPAFVTSTVRDVTGKEAGTFLEWATRNASAFRD